MARKLIFSTDEWYHCYNRGIDKRIVFDTEFDAQRFLELLYLVNDTKVLHRADFSSISFSDIFERKRDSTLVHVVAYALMPNHYHLILKEKKEDGISTFMQKLGTAYTMYYNAKYERTGNLFNKPFRAKHIKDDRYLQHVVRYVHLNPAEIVEKGFKEGKVKNREALVKYLETYPYSSLPDFLGAKRYQKSILDKESIKAIDNVSVRSLIKNASEYYEEFTELAL